MAKHPHKLILMQKKTWRCVLDGCNFFVHLGLAHVLIGKTGKCWECGDDYKIDEYALQDEMPRCMDCRSMKLERLNPLGKIEQLDPTPGSQMIQQSNEGLTKQQDTSEETMAALRKMGIIK